MSRSALDRRQEDRAGFFVSWGIPGGFGAVADTVIAERLTLKEPLPARLTGPAGGF